MMTLSDYILAPLHQEMRCGIFTNAKGEVLVIHDQNINGDAQWAEFDQTTSDIILVFEGGETQSLGLTLDEKAKNNVLNAQELRFALIKEKKIINSFEIPIVIRQY